jgi:hypothetical protein
MRQDGFLNFGLTKEPAALTHVWGEARLLLCMVASLGGVLSLKGPSRLVAGEHETSPLIRRKDHLKKHGL